MAEHATPKELVEALKTLLATSPGIQDQDTSEKRNMAMVYVHDWVLRKANALLGVRCQHREDGAHEIAERIALRQLCDKRRLKRVINAESPRRYLQGMIQNLIYDIYRDRQNRWEEGFLPLADAGRVQDPRDAQEVVDTADAISLLWEHMTDKEKEFVHLRFWKDLSLRATADKLGIEYHAAAQRQKRLMDKLRAVLEPAES